MTNHWFKVPVHLNSMTIKTKLQHEFLGDESYWSHNSDCLEHNLFSEWRCFGTKYPELCQMSQVKHLVLHKTILTSDISIKFGSLQAVSTSLQLVIPLGVPVPFSVFTIHWNSSRNSGKHCIMYLFAYKWESATRRAHGVRSGKIPNTNFHVTSSSVRTLPEHRCMITQGIWPDKEAN